jgi:DNA-binding NarL/FixJ family response regulator
MADTPNQNDRVLIVDDSRMMQMRLKGIVEELGLTVCGLANNGADAITLALETDPRCVVLDYNMPEMNGLECAHQLRQKLPAARVIICAAEVDPVLRSDFYHEGVIKVLQKPVPLEAFESALQEAMAA